MKTSLRRLLCSRKNDGKDGKIRPLSHLDELAKASEDLQEMRDCYDSLLSAAAVATNSAYEFSESLREMGACLLQKFACNDVATGKIMLILGKVQFELQKIVDGYRSDIVQTITAPSESLINEVHIVEEMKNLCDEKRELYEYMRTRYRQKGSARNSKGESFSSQQLQATKDEFDEEANLFVFRVRSLKQGQSRSLLTQAARHHATQLSFFRKALKSLEAVEPHLRLVTQQQHIDYKISGVDELEVVEADEDNEEDTGSISSISEDDEELSFNYRRNDQLDNFVSSTRNTMEENVKGSYRDSFMRENMMLSQSAPLFSPQKFDPAERTRQFQQSSSGEFHSYVLPKPGDTRSSIGNTSPLSQSKSSPQHTQNVYHSYPLEPNKHEKLVVTDNLSVSLILNSKEIRRESNNNSFRPPLPERISPLPLNPHAISSIKELKLQPFSGTLESKSWSTKPSLSANDPVISKGPSQFSSGPILRSPINRSLSSRKVSPSTSPTFISSPRTNKLHELPTPPVHVIHNSSRTAGFVGFSAPLVSRSPENSIKSKTAIPKIASPLPTPPQAAHLSTPSNGPMAVTRSPPSTSRPLEAPYSSKKLEDTALPPPLPSTLANLHPA